jgi:hypothetical protein
MTAEPASSPCYPPMSYKEGREPRQTLVVSKALTSDFGDESTGFAVCALGDDLQTASEARRFTRITLGDWRMTDLTDTVTLVVAELLSNAMRHGLKRTLADRPVSYRRVWLGLLRRGGGVLCTVSDPSAEVPVVREPDHLAESGRGLHLIDSLSESWGWTTPDAMGKSVWAMVAAPGS